MPICGRINQICHLISSGIRLNFDRKSSHIALSYHLENEAMNTVSTESIPQIPLIFYPMIYALENSKSIN